MHKYYTNLNELCTVIRMGGRDEPIHTAEKWPGLVWMGYFTLCLNCSPRVMPNRISKVLVSFKGSWSDVSFYKYLFIIFCFDTMNTVVPETADNIIQVMNKFISLDKNESLNSRKCLNGILEQMLMYMKEKDATFAEYYKKNVWAGSYWDNLKVGNPDEYDIDIVLGFPSKHYSIGVFNSKGNPGYVKVKLTKTPRIQINPNQQKVEKFLDNDGFILQNKFRHWFEGVVYKGLDSFPRASKNSWWIDVFLEESIIKTCKVSISKSGPAMTLIVNAENTFSVDLVPVIEMSWWPPPPFCKHVRQKEQPNWYIVPKPKKYKKSDDSWRCSFIYHERKLLHDTKILKPVLKLVKKFRDRQNLPTISSYYIKTVFMWETLEHKNNHTFFKKRQIDLFLHMLSKLRDSFEKAEIIYLWNKHLNLLSEWDKVACRNIFGKINNILLKIEKNINSDPEILITILLTDSEAQKFRSILKGQPSTVNQEITTCEASFMWNLFCGIRNLFIR